MNIFQRFEMNLEYNCCLKYCLNMHAPFLCTVHCESI